MFSTLFNLEIFLTNCFIFSAPANGFQKIGGGFCRSGINPKKYLNSILKDNTNNAQCKAKCESSVYCTG